MEHYDPLIPPDPKDWLSRDEDDRHALIREYHERARIKIPGMHMHAAFHDVVECQLAADYAPTRRALERLMADGLDRHEAIHAIGSVLVGLMTDAKDDLATLEDPTGAYERGLDVLMVESWRRDYGEPAKPRPRRFRFRR